MPTNYPGSVDSLSNPGSGDSPTSPSHAGQHTDANDAIEAIETELGTDPAGTHTDVKTRLSKLGASVSVRHSGTQTIPNTTATALNFDTERFDTDGFHSTSVNISRLTVPTGFGGKYLVTGGTHFAANATGFRQVRISVNGVPMSPAQKEVVTSGSVGSILSVAVLLNLADADYVTIEVEQTSGGDLNAGHASVAYAQSSLQMVRVGD